MGNINKDYKVNGQRTNRRNEIVEELWNQLVKRKTNMTDIDEDFAETVDNNIETPYLRNCFETRID